MSQSRRRLLAVGCAVVLGLAACTGGERTGTEPSTPPPLAKHPEAAPAKDRDHNAVLAALRRLELCAVLDSAVHHTPGYPADARPEASDLFLCGLSDAPKAGHHVQLAIQRLEASRRLTMPARTVGGAKAYVNDLDASCTVYLPVSFTLAIGLTVGWPRHQSGDRCGPALKLATAAAGTLADPAAARVHPQWDACSVLAVATGDDTSEHIAESSLNSCSSTRVDLSTGYRTARAPSASPPETIAGKAVTVTPADGSGCLLRWRVGPAPSRYADGPDLVASLHSDDCARAREVAAPIVRALATPPSGHTPQHPILYRPDEPDVASPGACAYFHGASETAQCRPYVDVPVPSDRAKLVRAAEVDPNVYCALARTAVPEHFGAQLRPVTVVNGDQQFDRPRFDDERAPRICYFVEPKRTVQIAVGMWLDSPRDLTRDLRKIEIAGHPGYVDNAQAGGDYDIWVGMTTDAEHDGMLALRIEPGAVTEGQSTELDPRLVTKARPVLADILAEHFA